jgi:hypothetical protein
VKMTVHTDDPTRWRLIDARSGHVFRWDGIRWTVTGVGAAARGIRPQVDPNRTEEDE